MSAVWGRPGGTVSEFNWFLVFVHLVLAPGTALHAMLYKRDPRAAFGWIAVCVLLPLGGPILYLVFGINRVRTRAARKVRGYAFAPGYERGDATEQPHPLPADLEPEYDPLARVGAALSRHPLAAGNRLEALHNGEQAYPAMLEAIRGAQRRVVLTTYILDTDTTGTSFIDALQEATERGVEVCVMVDGLGEWYSRPRASVVLRERGVRCAVFLPITLLPPSLHVNLRNHQKILVVDGRIAFTGGMNIGDRHLAGALDNPARVIDMHFQLHGPIVAQLEQVFVDSWYFVTGESIEPSPAPAADGPLLCRTVTDGPDEDLDRLSMLLTAAIALARQRVLIMTPYLLPPRELVGALQSAAVRGVNVTIVLPGKNNLPYVHWATRNMLWELLQNGVRVVYQPPPFVHTKLFVVDDCYSLVGSANWDSRSLRLNFELMVEIYGAETAEALAAHIDQAVRDGTPVQQEELDNRPLLVRLRDSLCWLFTPYL